MRGCQTGDSAGISLDRFTQSSSRSSRKSKTSYVGRNATPAHIAQVKARRDANPAVLRAVTANGALVLRAASYSLIVVPTGEPPPWDHDAADPWLSLPRRELVAEDRKPSSPAAAGHRRRAPITNVSVVAGLAESGRAHLLEAGEAIEGHLVIASEGAEQRLHVGAPAAPTASRKASSR